MAIKLIALDMDGTLLDRDSVTIPRRNVEALQRASQAGVKIAIASGRTWSMLQAAAQVLGCVDYGILSNGGAVWDPVAGKTIYEKSIPNAQALEIIDILQKAGTPFELYCQGQNYLLDAYLPYLEQYGSGTQFLEFYRKYARFPSDLAQALDGRGAEKFNIFLRPDQREAVESQSLRTGPLAVTRAMEINLEFNAPGVNKGQALQALAGQLGISADEVMAFGDGENDMEMLSWAGHSFAMANAMEAVKAVAKHQAPANDQAGVGQMVEQYVLKEK